MKYLAYLVLAMLVCTEDSLLYDLTWRPLFWLREQIFKALKAWRAHEG